MCQCEGAYKREIEHLKEEIAIRERSINDLTNENASLKKLLNELTEQIKKRLTGIGSWPL